MTQTPNPLDDLRQAVQEAEAASRQKPAASSISKALAELAARFSGLAVPRHLQHPALRVALTGTKQANKLRVSPGAGTMLVQHTDNRQLRRQRAAKARRRR